MNGIRSCSRYVTDFGVGVVVVDKCDTPKKFKFAFEFKAPQIRPTTCGSTTLCTTAVEASLALKL